MLRHPVLWLVVLVSALGCDAPIEHFPTNKTYSLTLARSRDLPTDAALVDAATITESLFGTPHTPRWPLEAFAGKTLVDLDRLTRAAGPVSSGKDGTHQGLYREHCVNCHGLAGSGTGPASLFQNPYPRNFRFGVFKWKSTVRDAKPTRNDLLATLHHGIPGTAMPSFGLLDPEDLEALVDYAIYLSVRGEVERRLMSAAIDELGYEEDRPKPDLVLAINGDSEGAETVREVVSSVVESWSQTEKRIAPAPSYEVLEGRALIESIERGRAVFHGPIANCVGCHGKDGAGDVTTLDYDDWDKEFSTRIGLTPTDRQAMRPFRKAGALKPRPIRPRRLADGVFRGGNKPATLYRRITQGIAGTPMPTVEVVEVETGKGLTSAQVWDLVRYLKSFESDS